jgi:CDP-glucose 4,6-dehydratase
LDTSKAVGQLGYRPRVDLDTALDWTAEWYRAFLDHQEMANITHEQIDRFERLGASFRGSALMTGPGSNDALHTL